MEKSKDKEKDHKDMKTSGVPKKKDKLVFESASSRYDSDESSSDSEEEEKRKVAPLKQELKQAIIEPPKPVSPDMREIIMSQKASGSWPLRAVVAEEISGINL